MPLTDSSGQHCYKHGVRVAPDEACVLCLSNHPPLVCDVCRGESNTDIAGVAAIPGAPISIAWCVTCLRRRNAVPTFILEHDYVYVAGGDLSRLAEWAVERETWADGRYMTFKEYVKRFSPEDVQRMITEYDRQASELGSDDGVHD